MSYSLAVVSSATCRATHSSHSAAAFGLKRFWKNIAVVCTRLDAQNWTKLFQTTAETLHFWVTFISACWNADISLVFSVWTKHHSFQGCSLGGGRCLSVPQSKDLLHTLFACGCLKLHLSTLLISVCQLPRKITYKKSFCVSVNCASQVFILNKPGWSCTAGCWRAFASRCSGSVGCSQASICWRTRLFRVIHVRFLCRSKICESVCQYFGNPLPKLLMSH